MTEKRYKFTIIRLINLWALPAFFSLLITILLYFKFDTFSAVKLVDIIAWVLFFLFAVGLFKFLFFNHLPHARQTELIIADKHFKILQGDQFYSGNISEIKEIIEYSANRLPWGFVVKWKIIVDDQELIVSSLTISKSSFERYFYDKIKHQFTLLPTI